MYKPTISRRSVIAGSLAFPVVATFPDAIAQDDVVDPATLKPGEFRWHPERSPAGPVVVLVSIPGQWVVVYRGGLRIGASTCSTGKPGHRTPSGVFVILQKDKNHHSSTYNNAPMPYMERLTWQGVALHAGNLPGFPASHGCIRLPLAFAKSLFGVTMLGTPVIVADGKPAYGDMLHPGLLISSHTSEMAAGAVQSVKSKTAHPVTATVDTHEATSFVASTADRKLIAFVNGKQRFEAAIRLQEPDKPVGTHAFVLTGPDSDPRHLKWMAVGLPTGTNAASASALLALATLKRIDLDPKTAQRVLALMHPGSTMVVTDQPSHAGSRSDPGFTIITHDT
jgi:hypothetical protein